MTIRRTDVLTKSNCQAIFTRPLHFFSMQTLVYRIQIKTTLQKLHRLMDALKGLLYIYIEAKPFLSFFLSIHYFTSFQQLQKLHTTFFCQGNRSCLLLCRYQYIYINCFQLLCTLGDSSSAHYAQIDNKRDTADKNKHRKTFNNNSNFQDFTY